MESVRARLRPDTGLDTVLVGLASSILFVMYFRETKFHCVFIQSVEHKKSIDVKTQIHSQPFVISYG